MSLQQVEMFNICKYKVYYVLLIFTVYKRTVKKNR